MKYLSQILSLSQKADEILQRNERLFKSISPSILVDALASDDQSIRKIAISKLEEISNTELGYDPDADESSQKDGVKVWLGKTLNTMKLIAVDWSEYGYGGYKTELNLEKGLYDIRINFFENKGGAHIEFSWDSEYVSKGIVPPENLFHIE